MDWMDVVRPADATAAQSRAAPLILSFIFSELRDFGFAHVKVLDESLSEPVR
jgi:hypothetical protein